MKLMVLTLFCASVDPIESLAEVMNYFQRDVLFGKDLSLIGLKNSRQEPSAGEFRYLPAKHRVNRVFGEVSRET